MSAEELPSRYEPKRAEERWYAEWEGRGDFTPDMEAGAPAYSIVIPPPNVTGYLHMGHALQHTLMDILARRNRMRGYRTLWLPGTDHAGISTQVVVERQLKEQGVTRHEIGRAEFERRVWAWREHSGGTIQRQIRREGASVDWTRERFTLDEGLSRAVREVFVSLHEEGLIYRGPRLVNWCVNHGALSDLESPKEETKGALYEISYPVAGSDERVTIATTRPETMLGDTALAVHPEDERYQHLIGRTAILPLVGREIPFVADEAVERHNLPQVTVIGFDGRMTSVAGERFARLDRFEARKAVVEALEAEGLLGAVTEYTHQVPRCDRCKSIIEPLISEQWFLEVKAMADETLVAVRDGRTRFIPERWTKVYTDWMENIQPWCISRQLWWGHRIPAWYCPDGHVTVSREDPHACETCGSPDLRQDPDVLDTWFSSALWPFSTLGWPEKTPDLATFYPTSVLVTGFDIIFFWVARMMMMGLKFMKDVPFREVLMTGLILDGHGEKMSKMKNNTIDPIDVFEKYGVDATRFTLAAAAQAGSDIKWRDDRVEEYRNFVNKIWNASRFVLMNLGDTDRGEWVDTPEAPAALADRWILSRFNRAARSVNTAIDDYRFHEAASTLYHFFWDEFCSWYIELSKPLVAAREVTSEVDAARRRIAHVLEMSLTLLSPFMPYVAEEIWQRLPHEGDTIGLAPYPGGDENAIDERVEADMGYVIELITKVRNIRSEMNLPKKPLRLIVATTDARVRDLMRANESDIRRLAGLEALDLVDALPDLGVAGRDVLANAELAVPLEGLIDVAAERARIERELEKAEAERGPLARKLENASFVERAARDVVDATRARVAELDTRIARLRALIDAMR
jgi:valyl-tRNA synthetase